MSKWRAAVLLLISLAGGFVCFWLVGACLFGAFGSRPSFAERIMGAVALLGFGVAMLGMRRAGARLLEKEG